MTATIGGQLTRSPAASPYPAQRATAADLYVDLVRRVVADGSPVPPSVDPSSVGSGFGTGRAGVRELLAQTYNFVSVQPVLPTSVARPTDLAYAAGLLLWMLGGSSGVDWVAYYNERGRAFSSDGVRFNGAPGPRLMSGPQSLFRLASVLRHDPSSRRAIVSVIGDSAPEDLDFACQSTFQWLIRRHEVVAQTVMRSQSAMMVLPYDIFVATALHGLVAAELKLPPTEHQYFAGSLHIYEDEMPRAERLATEGAQEALFLPVEGGLSALPSILRFEQRLRNAVLDRNHTALQRYCDELGPARSFWDEIKIILAAYGLHRAGLDDREEQTSDLLSSSLRGVLQLRARAAATA